MMSAKNLNISKILVNFKVYLSNVDIKYLATVI